MTQDHGKTIKINVGEEAKDGADDRSTALQTHARTEPVPVKKKGDPASEPQSGQRSENGGDTEALEQLRQEVTESQSVLKGSDEILAMIDRASKKTGEDRAAAAELLKRLVKAEKEAWENRDRWVRAVADLENNKKRALQEKIRLLKYQYEDLLRDLLPVLDNLERALAHSEKASTSDGFVEGVSMIAGMLRGALEKYGVTEVKALNEKFDPNFHEALSRVPAEGKEPNTVVEELQKGYLYKDRLLRPAKVVISG